MSMVLFSTLVRGPLWSARNRTVFKGEHLSLSSLFAQTMSLLHATVMAFSSGAQGVVRPRLPADPAILVLNVDGSAVTNPGQTGFRGLARDHDGSFAFGFCGSLGISNILHAEIKALRVGIKLC